MTDDSLENLFRPITSPLERLLKVQEETLDQVSMLRVLLAKIPGPVEIIPIEEEV